MEIEAEDYREIKGLLDSVLNKYEESLSFAQDGSLLDEQGNVYIRSKDKPMIKISECGDVADQVFGSKRIISKKDCIKVRIVLWPYNFPIYDHVAYAKNWNQPVDLESILSTFVGSHSICEKKVINFYSDRNLPFTHLQSIYFHRLETKRNKQGHVEYRLQIKVY